MEQPFAQYFKECCLQSCRSLADAQSQTSPEYAAYAAECSGLLAQISQKLGSAYKLALRFDAAKNAELAWGDEWIYQQGFHDCIYLLHWMGVL